MEDAPYAGAAYAMEEAAVDGQEWADAYAPDASAADDTNMAAEEEDCNVIDIIHQSALLAKAQQEAEDATTAIEQKRQELEAALEAAEAEAEEKEARVESLQEEAQDLADDEQWHGMFYRLRTWSEEKGHCNPRRNWQSKIDAEEKALGNWCGKQRRDERQGKLNPYKKEALERIGFTFDTKKQGWEEFHEKLKAYLIEHDKVPSNLHEPGFKGTDVSRKLIYYRNQPKKILGLLKDGRRNETGESVRREQHNAEFTQDKIDVLTAAGLNWTLTREHVERLRDEKGLNFPMPQSDGRPDDGDLVCLEKHAWLSNYEALVEFKRLYGHTYVTPFNSSRELSDWVKEQRKRMLRWERKRLAGNEGAHGDAPVFNGEAESLKDYHKLLKERSGSGKSKKDRLFRLYQRQMLEGLGFVYHQPDVDWMEQYERLAAFRRLFGTIAIPNKYASFEHLQGWLDENKRQHLNLPPFEPLYTTVESASESIHIPLSERQKLLSNLGALEVSFGGEEEEAHKSHYFFRTAEQVQGWDTGVVKTLRETRKQAIDNLTAGIAQEKNMTAPAAIKLDPKRERDFFYRHGAIVAASVEGREKLPFTGDSRSGGKRFYPDGRPSDLCRITRCFDSHGTHRKQYLCERHFDMIESLVKSEAQRAGFHTVQPPSNVEGSNPAASAKEWLCTYCEKEFDSYAKAARHEMECGTVQVATEIPAPNNYPAWTKPSIPDHLTGEARTLAKHYSSLVCKVTMGYNAKPATNATDEHVLAALGQNPPNGEEGGFCLPAVKFPSKKDEVECTKLFHRCAGPLAATVSGREQLVKDGKPTYGDGRPTLFCRVSGCQLVFAERASVDKRFLCNWHHAMVQRDYGDKEGEASSAAGKRKKEQAFPKTAERRARKKAKNETSKVLKASAVAKGTASFNSEKKPAALPQKASAAAADGSKPLEPNWWKKYRLPPPPPPVQGKAKSADTGDGAPCAGTGTAQQKQGAPVGKSSLTSSEQEGPADGDVERFMDC